MKPSQFPRLKAIIFDFDGTLAELHLDFQDMKRRLAKLARKYFQSTPEPPPVPALEWLDSMVCELRTKDPEAARKLNENAHALIVDIEMRAADKGSLFPFTRPMLDRLKRLEIETAIITRNCEQAVRKVFPDLDEYCKTFLARDHVPRVKPDPDHLLRAIERMGVPLANTLMVGDHPMDIRTGLRAGILTAGVSSGNATQRDLLQCGAHWTAQNCRDLIHLLQTEKRL